VNEAPWFRSKAPKASPEDKFTRLPPPISSRSKHRRHFSSPVAFFTRRYKNTDAEKTALRRNDSGSSRSVTTEESVGYVAAPIHPANRDRRGTGFLHTRTRSEPVPAMFGTAAARAAAMAPPPPRTAPPPRTHKNMNPRGGHLNLVHLPWPLQVPQRAPQSLPPLDQETYRPIPTSLSLQHPPCSVMPLRRTRRCR
jgi:hypothetical protein